MANESVTPKIGTAELAAAVVQALEDKEAPPLAHPSGREYFQQAWEENPLSNPITNRMARVDYCLKAIGAIHTLIHQDETRASLVNDDPETYAYDRIPAYVRENLRLGITELLRTAEGCVEDIREDEHKIASRQAEGTR